MNHVPVFNSLLPKLVC